MKSEVKLSNVTKSFRTERVLKGITHSFEQGKIHGIMGFNGSGKTVMFKCICGFLRPDSGAVIVQGRRIGKDGDFPQSLGMIIESPGFLPHISGFANLKRLAAIRNRVTDEQIREGGFAAYFTDHTAGVYPTAAAGAPFNAAAIGVKGDVIADLTEDLAADGAMR